MSSNIDYKTVVIAIICSVILSTGIIMAVPQVQDVLRGPQGEPGPQGEQGQQGETGSPGESIVGPIGLTGDTGAIGLQGVQGIQGESGEQGIQGLPGTLAIQEMRAQWVMYTDRDSMFDMPHLGSSSVIFGSSSLPESGKIDTHAGYFYIRSDGPIFGIYWFADYCDLSGASFRIEVTDADRSDMWHTYTVADMIHRGPESDAGMMYIFGPGSYKVRMDGQRGIDWLVQIILYTEGVTCSTIQPADWPWGT